MDAPEAQPKPAKFYSQDDPLAYYFRCSVCEYDDILATAKFCGGCGVRIQPMMPVRGAKGEYAPYDPEKNYGPEEEY